MLLGPALREVERKLEDAVDADARHHGLLNDDFSRRLGKHPAADRRVLSFRIFPHDVEIDIAGLAIRQRRGNAWHQADRTKIDVLIELAPELQQRAP